MANNIILPFSVLDNAVKGKIIRLDSELDVILRQRQYPEIVAKILGELLLVSAMIGSLFKEEILLTIQLQTDSDIKYIVVDYQSPGNIRGYAQFNENIDWACQSYGALLSNASLILTIDYNLQKNQRYQAVVDVAGMSIAEAVEKYFAQSEQIKTAVKLAIGKVTIPGGEESWCCGGIMIQKLPGENDEELWNEALAYFKTVTDHEIIDPMLAIDKLLYSVYHEVNVIVYDHINIHHKCRCSKEKAMQVIKTLDQQDAIDLAKNNQLSITCHFCNQVYNLSLADLEL